MKIKLNNKGSYNSLYKGVGFVNLFLFLLITLPTQANANFALSNVSVYNLSELQTTVTGTVSDADGPLAGVNVLVKGTSNGTMTDFDGNYSIAVDSGAVLMFSYIGYAAQEVTVGSQSNINVTLAIDASKLEEVVVVGYTTRKKGEVTGSVSTISSEAIEQSSSKDVAKSLAGRASGLVISDRGGVPGQGNGSGSNTNDDATTILVRGKATTGNNTPLILIDGVAAGSFSQLAPQDIESLTVLKDGAAAIYGTRAANGVILITTKRGKTGKAKISFSTTYTISKFSAYPDLMSSEQYAIYENEIAGYNGTALPFSQSDINNYASGTDPINFPNTDWGDLTFSKTSPETRHSISVSGGSENIKYFVSGDALSQEGIYKSGDLGFKQYQLRSNIDMKLSKSFKLGLDVAGRVGEAKEPGVDRGVIFKHIFTNPPNEVGVYPNGLPGFGGENGRNPVIMSSNQSGFSNRTSNNLRARITYDWGLNSLVDGLSLRGYVSGVQQSNENKAWDTPWTYYQLLGGEYVPSQGNDVGPLKRLRESFWKSNQFLVNSTLHYTKLIGEKHNINTFVGYEHSKTQNNEFFAQRSDFPVDLTQLNIGDPTTSETGGEAIDFGFISYFGSLSYDFDKKYFVDFTLRHDASTNFPSGRQFGTFPGVAVSWAIDNESFLENSETINSLKLRASWAELGNDRIDPFQYLGNYGFGYPSAQAGVDWIRPDGYVFGTPGQLTGGFGLTGVANPLVTWETAQMMNLGLSFALFDNKLSGDVNYFYQDRKDVLVANSGVPDIAGFGGNLPPENIGEMDSFGWELELGWNDTVGDVNYNLGFNFTNAQSKVVSIGEADNIPEWRKQEGKPIDTYVVYPTAGIFRDQAQVDATTVKLANSEPGHPIYVDTDGNGEIDANDRVRQGVTSIPQIQYGFYGGLNVKNFNFNFLFQGQAKAETLVFFDQAGAKPSYVFNQRWTPNNTSASYPRAFAQGDNFSGDRGPQGSILVNNGWAGADLHIRDASFLRLKEVEIGYTLPRDLVKFADVKLFVRGYNVLTMFSDIYDLGLDPEAVGYNNFRNSTYPSLTSYTFGLNINF